jgi:NAD(P)-dependent dehydrogenase (short-subunit alcohol dehydrogenase family)
MQIHTRAPPEAVLGAGAAEPGTEMGLLEGRKALITGGGSGIGRATARRMAAEGAAVCVLDLDADAADAVAKEVGGYSFTADVRDTDAVASVVAQAAAAMGGLDVMFNNAGTSFFGPLHMYTPEAWGDIVGVHLTGVFNGIRAAAPLMVEAGGGAIVNTASISGTRPSAGEAPYASAKAGIVALTAVAAIEYAPTVRVNAVSPGMIDTKLTEPLKMFPDRMEQLVAKTPLARIGTPEEIADVVVFLCSDLARFVTGQNLVIDGGMTLHGSGVDGLLDYFLAFAPSPEEQEGSGGPANT